MKVTLTRLIAPAPWFDYDAFSNVRFYQHRLPVCPFEPPTLTVHPSRVEAILTSRFIMSLLMQDSNPDPDEAFELCTLRVADPDSNPRVSMLAFNHMAGPLDIWDEGEEETEVLRRRGRVYCGR